MKSWLQLGDVTQHFNQSINQYPPPLLSTYAVGAGAAATAAVAGRGRDDELTLAQQQRTLPHHHLLLLIILGLSQPHHQAGDPDQRGQRVHSILVLFCTLNRTLLLF